MSRDGRPQGGGASANFSEWHDIANPAKVDALPEIDISRADRLRDRREMKRVFHAFGIVRNEDDGREVTFPAASVGKMLYMSGTDVRGIAAAFADLYRASVRAWSEPNRKIPATDRRRAHEAVHQYVAKFKNVQGRFYVRFTVKANTGGASPRSEVHASVISRISIYANGNAGEKERGAELSTPANTRAEDSTPFTDDKISYYLSEVNRAKFADARGGVA